MDIKSAETSTGPQKASHSQNLRETAYSAFISCLSQRKFRPGRLLSQREISEVTGSPITAVREALKRLEAEQLVELVPQKGVQLRELGAEEIKEIYQARKLIEVPGVKLFAQNADPRLIEGLIEKTKAILSSAPQTREERGLQMEQRTALDHEIHRHIVNALGSELLSDFAKSLNIKLIVVRLQLPALYSDKGAAFEEHLKLLNEIASGSPEIAADILEDHLDQACLRAMDAVDF